MSKEIESVIKKISQQRKARDQMISLSHLFQFYQTLKEELMPVLLKLF